MFKFLSCIRSFYKKRVTLLLYFIHFVIFHLNKLGVRVLLVFHKLELNSLQNKEIHIFVCKSSTEILFDLKIKGTDAVYIFLANVSYIVIYQTTRLTILRNTSVFKILSNISKMDLFAKILMAFNC